MGATFYEGSQYDGGKGIGYDASGNIILAGNTESSDLPGMDEFSFDMTYNNDKDAFLVHFNYNTSIIWKEPADEDYDINQNITIDNIFNDITVYPNPAEYEINIRYEHAPKGIIEIELLNLAGEKIYSFVDNAQEGNYERKISLKGLPSGMYFIRINYDGTNITHKIIKME